MIRFVNWLLGGPPADGWRAWLVARSATAVAVLIVAGLLAVAASTQQSRTWLGCGARSLRWVPCPLAPSATVAPLPTAVATVTERFSRPPDFRASTKGGVPLATPGPPRGAPPTPTADPAATPAVFGPFRLIPPLWEGETISEVVPLPAGMVVSDDPAVVATSPLYRAVPSELLIGDLALVRAEAGTLGVVLNFDSATDENLSLQVLRLARTALPENRRVYGGTRTAIVEGRYLLVNDSYPPGPVRGLPPGSESRPYRIIVTAGAGGVVVEVEGIGYDEETLVEIAKVMVP